MTFVVYNMQRRLCYKRVGEGGGAWQQAFCLTLVFDPYKLIKHVALFLYVIFQMMGVISHTFLSAITGPIRLSP